MEAQLYTRAEGLAEEARGRQAFGLDGFRSV